MIRVSTQIPLPRFLLVPGVSYYDRCNTSTRTPKWCGVLLVRRLLIFLVTPLLEVLVGRSPRASTRYLMVLVGNGFRTRVLLGES